ncbi:hypothetical protein MRB53_022830 [Persea americana]|uniref:Uncharacterized protein n=1 Tax=Persea americana TaxID=3435 RepID=A0ACC2L8S0_PERAE|nr:hypothetical protein MRB53_022830 [Persea americana]
MICNLLISPDCIRMQFVCKSWQSILKNSSSRLRELPWLMMLPRDKDKEEEYPDARDFFSLSRQKIFTVGLPETRGKRCCGSFQNGWLMTVDIDLNSTFEHQNYVAEEGAYTIEEIRDLHICKAALSDDANMVVAIYGLGHSAFCRIGDKVWTEIDEAPYTVDVVHHNGQFYALSPAAGIHLFRCEDNAPRFEKLTQGLDPHGPGPSYLVPDIVSDSKFVIIRDEGYIDDTRPRMSRNFDIYKAPAPLGKGAPDKELTKVESLGDRIVFLGYNSSIIVMAGAFPGFKGNRIYFGDNCPELYFRSPRGCCDSGVFNVGDRKVQQLFADRFHPPSAPPLSINCNPAPIPSTRNDYGEEKLHFT